MRSFYQRFMRGYQPLFLLLWCGLLSLAAAAAETQPTIRSLSGVEGGGVEGSGAEGRLASTPLSQRLPRSLSGVEGSGAEGSGVEGSGVAPRPSYSFGVLSQRSPLLTAEYWNPILAYIGQQADVELLLKVARTAPDSNAAIAQGTYDFVYSNTIFQPKMATANYQVLLRPAAEAIRGQIVTLADSPIQNLSDLADQTVGFPSRAAFVGYAVPMEQLLRRAIPVLPVFGGNQEGIMAQLKAGKVIAAGVNSQVMRSFAHREHLSYRVLWESQGFLNIPIAAHPRVPSAVVMRVQAAFNQMDQTPVGLLILENSARIIGEKPPLGFRTSSPEDYLNYPAFYRSTLVKDFE